jgi:hypothetical protein
MKMLKLVTRGKSDVFDPHTGESLVLLDDKMVGTVYRPTKLLVLPDGELALLLGYRDQWRIWSDDAENGQCISEAYAGKSAAETVWQKLCAELTAPIRARLAARLESETDEEICESLLEELVRIEIANDWEPSGQELRAANPEFWNQFVERQGEVTNNGN